LQIISLVLLLCMSLSLTYLLVLALASFRPARRINLIGRRPSRRFCILIAAHNEAAVIGSTVKRLCALDYPAELFHIHVAADHCTDDTAALARKCGAFVHERNEGPRTGKGAALAWLMGRVLKNEECDGVVIFDADTRVDRNFLRIMEHRLEQGHKVIQGQHVISNPNDGLFPKFTWAMFMVDNRFQNLGRSNLGWSAKNMGDSVCFSAEAIQRLRWPDTLAEDHELRQHLLLEGMRIIYEPAAVGYGEAPLTWSQARAQRLRWLQGARHANRKLARRLLAEGIKRRDSALIDGALQAYLPSFSTLTIAASIMLSFQVLINTVLYPVFDTSVITGWCVLLGVLLWYPFLGLALERAPLRAYLASLAGPVFILWRTGIALSARLGLVTEKWVPTLHGRAKEAVTR
jgi:cellulose synthase/poly-beta-1,6-N-acetylglucosamine synthase-like glycosyltransferase